MPEGIELDKAAATEFSAIAKELKLDQPTAQKVADVAAKMIQRQAEVYAEQVAGWGESVRTDKEFGGDKLDENLGLAKKAVEKFGSPELQKLLDSPDKGGFGLGNHPEVVRLFYRIGKAISEDGFVRGGATVTDAAAAMYPSMTPKT